MINDYIISFFFGLIGSIHCIGMCGGIIYIISTKSFKNNFYMVLNFAFYNIGRLLSYGLLGFFLGWIGDIFLYQSNYFFIKISKFCTSILIVVIGLYLLEWCNFFFILINYFINFLLFLF